MNAMWGALFTLLLILYMGLRPVSGAFGDTTNYANGFLEYSAHPNHLHGFGKQIGYSITCMLGLLSTAISIPSSCSVPLFM